MLLNSFETLLFALISNFYENNFINNQSIRIVSFKQWFIGWSVAWSLVLAELCQWVGLCSCQECLLSSFNVLILSVPCLNGAILKGSTKRETQEPGSSDVLNLIHVVQMQWGFLFSLTSWQESDSNQSWRNWSWKGSDSSDWFFLQVILLLLFMGWSISDHVWLQKTSFKQDVVLLQSCKNSSQNLFGDSLAMLGRVRTVWKDFRFNDWYETVFLANGSIPSQSPSIFLNSLFRWESLADLENSSPLGESATQLIELFGHGGKSVQTFGPVFTFCVQNAESLVDLDTWNDSHWGNVLDEVDSFIVALLGSFFLENDSWNELIDARRCEKHVSVSSSVFSCVLQVDSLEFLLNWSWWLISSQDTFSRGTDFMCSLNEFLWEILSFHF